MKAYTCTNDETGVGVVVFAETRGKAKAIIIHLDEFDYYTFTELRVYREPRLDSQYQGYSVMDWYNAHDRMALVSLGWYCIEPRIEECISCIAKDACEWYQDRKEESL